MLLKLPRLAGPPNINQWSEMGQNFIFEVGLGASWPSFIFTNFGGQRPKLASELRPPDQWVKKEPGLFQRPTP